METGQLGAHVVRGLLEVSGGVVLGVMALLLHLLLRLDVGGVVLGVGHLQLVSGGGAILAVFNLGDV